ncbi:MAG: hypothetical protein PWQ79_1988 [Thermococcaceae archaeon]|nr:hypothetical protein [Thermococcaceae archaeon]MDK2915073.1 hypothetical protein [Thermococcaceae archaeon]
MRTIGKEKRLDEFLKNLKEKPTKTTKKSILRVMEENDTHDSALIKGTIARTDNHTGMPHLDELTHHLIVVAMASLKFNSPETTLAALIHDYFKPMFDIRAGSWWHFITNPEFYSQLLEEFADYSSWKIYHLITGHHPCRPGNANKICQIESSGLISALETNVPFVKPETQDFIITHQFRVLGKYRMFLLALIKERLTKILSEEYSNKFQQVLGVKRIRYEYRPIDVKSSKIEEVGKQIIKEGWKIIIHNDTLIIPLPSKYHGSPFYFEYYEKPEIVIDFDEKAKVIRGIKIPFGKALSTVYLVGSRDAYIVYVDAGFESLHLQEIIEELLDYLRSLLSEKKRKTAFTGIELGKVVTSLAGEFKSDRACLFCGEPGEPITDEDSAKSILKNKFTDTWSFLSYEKAICPACKLGFEIEKNFRSGLVQYLIHEAIIEETKLPANIPIFKQQTFVKSISSKIWLELISDIYYSLHKEQDKMNKKNAWLAKFYLDPAVIVYPYSLRIIPQISLISPKSKQQKKFVLQSGLHSNVVFPGEEKDMTPDEFKKLRRFYLSNPDLGPYLLQEISRRNSPKSRGIYSPLFGIPKVEIGGGPRARKRKG